MMALAGRQCRPYKKGESPLDDTSVNDLLGELDQWQVSGSVLSRTFRFANYYATMAFVNAVAWIAHGQDHHPDMEVGYNRCTVHFTTHSIGGLSDNDFICAACIDALGSGEAT